MRGGTEQAQEPALTGLGWLPQRRIEKKEAAAEEAPSRPGCWREGGTQEDRDGAQGRDKMAAAGAS